MIDERPIDIPFTSNVGPFAPLVTPVTMPEIDLPFASVPVTDFPIREAASLSCIDDDTVLSCSTCDNWASCAINADELVGLRGSWYLISSTSIVRKVVGCTRLAIPVEPELLDPIGVVELPIEPIGAVS